MAEFSLVTVDRAAIDQAAQAGDRKPRDRSSARCRSCPSSCPPRSSASPSPRCSPAIIAAPAFATALRPLISPWAGDHTDGRGALRRARRRHAAVHAVRRTGAEERGAGPADAAGTGDPPVRCGRSPRRCSWLIQALNNTANFIVRRLGVEPQEELASARSPEELGLLAAISARAGAIPEDTAVLLRRTIRFGDKRAAEAMTPRVDVLGLAADATVADLLTTRAGDRPQPLPGLRRHARPRRRRRRPSPTRSASRRSAGRRTAVTAVAREPIQVPESLDLDDVLAALNAGQRRHGDRGRRVRRHRRRRDDRGPGRGVGRRDRGRARPRRRGRDRRSSPAT